MASVCQKESPRDFIQPVLLKIDLPNDKRSEVLLSLDAANINYLSLFPDLEGAARFSNVKIERRLLS
jgi:hypothetical protein